jgi:hypothetical protein
MQLEPTIRQPPRDRIEHDASLSLAHAADDRIVAVALEPDVRELPADPGVERIVE